MLTQTDLQMQRKRLGVPLSDISPSLSLQKHSSEPPAVTHRPIVFSFRPHRRRKDWLVKVLEFLFGRKDAVVRLDMSEYTEKHSIARLVGAQPGTSDTPGRTYGSTKKASLSNRSF